MTSRNRRRGHFLRHHWQSAELFQDDHLRSAFAPSGNVDQFALRIEGEAVSLYVGLQFALVLELPTVHAHGCNRAIARRAVQNISDRVEPQAVCTGGHRYAAEFSPGMRVDRENCEA